MSVPNLEVLMRKLEDSRLRKPIHRLLYQKGIIRTGDLAIRSREELLAIRGLSQKMLDEINGYLGPLGVVFRKDEPKAARIWELYGHDVPLSCMTLVVAEVSSWSLLALEEAGIVFLPDAKGAKAEQIARYINYSPESSAVGSLLRGIKELQRLLS